LLKSQSAIFSLKDSLGMVSMPGELFLMKYEISQRQYVDFLNALKPSQQGSFIEAVNAKVVDAAFPSFSINRNGIKFKTLASGDLSANFYSSEPFAACNGLSASDVLGYLCWAGLRPITEIEFEYAARGMKSPKQNEGAWGTSYCQDVNALKDSSLINETYNNPHGNDSAGIANYGLPVGNYYLQGPARSGALFTNSSNRISAGSGYFGHADLSGNVWELCLEASKIPNLIDLGTGNVEDVLYRNINWPNAETGYIYRGGGWNSIVLNSLAYPFRDIAISDRFYAGGNTTIRRNTTGGRGAL
jgi:formylglycine-generating enzyme required for sulfatase activity